MSGVVNENLSPPPTVSGNEQLMPTVTVTAPYEQQYPDYINPVGVFVNDTGLSTKAIVIGAIALAAIILLSGNRE